MATLLNAKRHYNTAYEEYKAVESCKGMVLDCKNWCKAYNRSKNRGRLDALEPENDISFTRTPPIRPNLKEANVVREIRSRRKDILKKIKELQERLRREEEYTQPNPSLESFFNNVCYFLDDRLLDERQLLYLNQTISYVNDVWPHQITVYKEFDRNSEWLKKIEGEVKELIDKFPDGKGMPTIRELRGAKDKAASLKTTLELFPSNSLPAVNKHIFIKMHLLRQRVEDLENSPFSLTNRKRNHIA